MPSPPRGGAPRGIRITAPISAVGATIYASRDGKAEIPVQVFVNRRNRRESSRRVVGRCVPRDGPCHRPDAPAQKQYQYPFQNPTLSIEERVTNIISLLTPEEKVDVLGANYYLGGGRPGPSLNRLGIYGYNQGEGLHGLARGKPPNGIPTTTFLQSIGLGETWDPDLLQKAAAVEGYEARWLNQTAKYSRGGSQSLIIRAPNADLGRDIRWGRNEECYGEDAFLNGTLTAAFVRGLQGNDPKYLQTAALLKHFLANSNENGRMGSSSNFDERLLREYYSVPFRMGVEAGARSYMAAYNGMNGIPMTAQPTMRDITIKEWGVDDIITTDAGSLDAMVSGSQLLPGPAHGRGGRHQGGHQPVPRRHI